MAGQDTEDLNAGSPEDDDRYVNRVIAVAAALASVAGEGEVEARAMNVAGAFLPDVLRYAPGEPVSFRPGGGNGRALTDDAFGAALALVMGTPSVVPSLR